METNPKKWQWDDTLSAESFNTARAQYKIEFEQNHTVHLLCIDQSGSLKWVQHIPTLGANQAELLAVQEQLFLALYSSSFTGCQIIAFNADSGLQQWRVQLAGLDTAGHSKYSNHVQMQFKDGAVVVLGNESTGKYIEVLDPLTGHQLYHQSI